MAEFHADASSCGMGVWKLRSGFAAVNGSVLSLNNEAMEAQVNVRSWKGKRRSIVSMVLRFACIRGSVDGDM